jgi:hypothetical protein
MRKTLALAATLALALSTGAMAKEQCHDSRTGRFMKCPPPHASHAMHCSKGKACGDSCIARDKVCHIPHR